MLSFLKHYLPFEDKTLEHMFDEQLKERNETMGIVEFLIEEAREEAREEAFEEAKLSLVRSLLANTDFDNGKIATLATVDVSLVINCRKEFDPRHC